ncbi:MAG: threonine--tRNA ligase [Candidatus Micrarchaeota archaeon]|nr:threonine--tRNA ligase [Candidatus Micrarchaeota archaeon]
MPIDCENMKARLPDGSSLEFNPGETGFDLASKMGKKLASDAIACAVNGKVTDLNQQLTSDCEFKVLTWRDQEGKEVFWHSASHVMAKAVKRLYPDAKLAIGPAIEGGFYYDFDLDHTFTPDDFKLIEQEFRRIVERNEKFERKEIPIKDAKKIFAERKEKYKLEMLEELEQLGEQTVSVYYTDNDFLDLCKGPHLPSTGKLKAFKVMKNAGAYWRGDSKNKMLQRLYAVAYPEQKMLDDHLKFLEEAEKRDHRKLGRELGIFMTHDYALAGSPFFLPAGVVIYNELQKFLREEYLKRGYNEVITPQVFKKALWETSGHWQHYRQNMFSFEIDGEEYALKAMNCPSHLLMFNSSSHSYKELPYRIADFGQLHRNELGGVLGGLTRVTKFAQDDAHIFVTPDQLEDEITDLLGFIKYVYGDLFGFQYKMKLSTKPEGAMGDPQLWEKAEEALANALKRNGIDYTINPGDGAFYGPKIDVDISDALNRPWQCATIQLDFQMPLRFNATYVDKDGTRKPVIMVHRAILGSMERFIGILIEHYAGKFPTWLSPIQAILLPLTDDQVEFCRQLDKKMKEEGIRSELDARNEKLEARIRDAQLRKIPYIITIGKRETAANNLSIRKRTGEVSSISVDEFLKRIKEEIKTRSKELNVI